ncbi:MAG: ribosomal RNA small subunit methyltransferase A [Magnetococcales bacterium]|nr:ribosomal RNA small subunit methyltransferase A [Magnetococcales bacterium]
MPSLAATLRTQGFRPSKRLGQNFLIDPVVPEMIVRHADVHPGDAVVEIGPGTGSLTRPLLDHLGELWCIERDRRLEPLLQTLLSPADGSRLHLHFGDALSFDFSALSQEIGRSLKIVANLPYSISTPILFHLLRHRSAVQSMTLMFQTEVADRLMASPNSKTYGALTINTQLWATVQPRMRVPPEAFHPRPKVESTVVTLTIRPKPAVAVNDPDTMTLLVQAAFNQRRKTLANALKSVVTDPKIALNSAEIDPKRRGETLTVAEFGHLSNTVQNLGLLRT